MYWKGFKLTLKKDTVTGEPCGLECTCYRPEHTEKGKKGCTGTLAFGGLGGGREFVERKLKHWAQCAFDPRAVSKADHQDRRVLFPLHVPEADLPTLLELETWNPPDHYLGHVREKLLRVGIDGGF